MCVCAFACFTRGACLPHDDACLRKTEPVAFSCRRMHAACSACSVPRSVLLACVNGVELRGLVVDTWHVLPAAESLLLLLDVLQLLELRGHSRCALPSRELKAQRHSVSALPAALVVQAQVKGALLEAARNWQGQRYG